MVLREGWPFFPSIILYLDCRPNMMIGNCQALSLLILQLLLSRTLEPRIRIETKNGDRVPVLLLGGQLQKRRNPSRLRAAGTSQARFSIPNAV